MWKYVKTTKEINKYLGRYFEAMQVSLKFHPRILAQNQTNYNTVGAFLAYKFFPHQAL